MRLVRFGDLPREFVNTTLLGLVVVPVFALVASRGLSHGSLWPHLAQVLEVVTAAATVAALSTAARRAEGRERQAWWLLAATIGFWMLGTGVYAVRGFLFGHFEGDHLSAEVFYICALPTALAGFARFPGDGGPLSGRLRPTLDALTVASSALFVSWDVALHTIINHRASGLGGWLALLYPVTDLALCTFAVLIASRAPANRRVSISLLAAGMFAMALADSSGVTLQALGRYHVGGLSDTGWIVGMVLGSLAALSYDYEPRTSEASSVAQWRSALLPYVLVVPAAIVACNDLLRRRLPDTAGVVIGILVVVLVSARQMLTVRENLQLVARLTGRESELRQQALHDVLTGLANRRLFRERLEESLRDLDPEEIAVVFVDLDDFKVVNDTMGHATGDDLLRKVANRLQTCVRGTDIAARLGGDEFAVLLTGGGLVAAQSVAARLNRALRQPILCGGQPLFIQASIGIAAGQDGISGFEGHGSTQLLEQADMAMYAAKDGGKARIEVFEPLMRERLLDRAAVKDDLARALGRNQLSLAYQPIVDLASGVIIGAEALLRWKHPQRGFIPPLTFIPLAEETGLIEPIGRWVLQTACTTAAGWQELLPEAGFQINVNVSAGQLLSTDIVHSVTEVLRTTSLRPDLLTVEITESVLMADNATVAAALADLRALGIRLAIDDFGTGYSSLSYLDRLPVDILKVDKAFVDRLDAPSDRAPLAGAIVGLSEMLGLEAVAEGIETSTQRQAMVDLGCRHGQGYLFSKPVDGDAFRALLELPGPRLGGAPLTGSVPDQQWRAADASAPAVASALHVVDV